MAEPVWVLLVSGSTRGASTNTAALRTMRELAPPGMVAVLYEGLAELPAFNPDDDGERLPAVVETLREELGRAGAVVFCTPEYAGTLPGSLKNLLDWAVGGGELYGKPVAWLNVAAEGRGEGAQATLATVLGYVGAVVVHDACVRAPVAREAVGADGLVADPEVRAAIVAAYQAIGRQVGTIAEG